MSLAKSDEKYLTECLDGIIRHRRKEAYAILGQGMWLMNACNQHALPVGRPAKQGNSATVALFPTEENAGFEQWLQENVSGPETGLQISRRTCYNYMKAAQAMGLKAGDGEEDLRALEEADAMAGKRISDLYKPALPEGGGGGGPPAPPPGGPEQMWLPFRAELSILFEPDSQSRMALHAMPLPDLEGLEDQLRFGLDAIREIKAAKATARGGRPKA